jgi:DUF1680 family protein
MGRRIRLTYENNIDKLDVDTHLLNHFRERESEGGYVGLGKLMDACILYSLCSGDPAIEEKKEYLVNTAIQCQEDAGYIGKVKNGNRMFSGATWDIHEMSYIIYSLSQNYRYYRDKESLTSAENAAKFIMSHWAEKPQGWQEKINVAETVALTGWEEALVNLYDLTKNEEYLDFLLNERDLKNWDLDIVIGRKGLIKGHVYSFMSRLLAQLKLYDIYPAPELLRQTAKAFDFLVNKDGMTITGGAGQIEIWDDSQDGRGSLAESCATAYFIRVCNQLVQLTGDSFYGDLMERSLYNSLFGAFSNNCTHTRYYTPFEGKRVYSKYASYCCSNNLRRLMPALPGMIYFQGSSSLAVNLYTESKASLEIDSKKVLIEQITDYPTSGTIKIELSAEKDMTFNLMLRIPSWSRKCAISINGEKIEASPVSGQFFIINRTWSQADLVEIQFDMQPRLVSGIKRQSGRAAVMRGPQLYCLNPANSGKISNMDGASLGQITLYPETLELIKDESFRPNGTALKVKVWPPGDYQTLPVNLHDIILTEFADPEGEAVYFKLQDLNKGTVPDELFRQNRIILPLP